jgi:hypothetical protein
MKLLAGLRAPGGTSKVIEVLNRADYGVGLRSSVSLVRIISGSLGKLVGPCVDDGVAIDLVDASRDALLELLL